MVDLAAYASFDPESVGVTEHVYYPVLKNILAECGDDEEALKRSDPQKYQRTDSEAYHQGRYHCFHQLQYASGRGDRYRR